MHQHRIVWADETNSRNVELLVQYSVLGDMVQVGTIRPTKVTILKKGTQAAAKELAVWTATGRRLLRRAFLKNHMGYVALQREVQREHDQRLAAAVA